MSISRKITEGAGSGSGGGSAGGYVDDVFSTYLYTGDSVKPRAIENGIDLDGEGGLVWVKGRSVAEPHQLVDTVSGGRLSSNLDNASEMNQGNVSFNSNGFTINSGSFFNGNGKDIASWTFRKAPSFFDVVTYTGTGVAGNVEIPHNLGVEPGMVIVKATSNSGAWYVWHRTFSNPLDDYLILNQTNGTANSSGLWGTSGVTDTSFSVQGSGSMDTLNDEYVAYVFAHDDSDEGMIQCGTYDGTTSPAKPEVDLGWEPQWVMIKRVDQTGNWTIVDSMRGITDGPADAGCNVLQPNNAGAEFPFDVITLTPTGFIVNGGNGDFNSNVSGAKYIYMAIRRPNKPAEEFEPEELFAISQGDGLAEPAYTSGFPVDMEFIRNPAAAGGSTEIASRLTGAELMRTNSDNAGSAEAKTTFDYMEGWRDQDQFAGNYLSWMWRRAPGFFDVVCYEGNGSSNVLPHNLQAQPEMVWLKVRESINNDTSANRDWGVMHKDGGDPRPTHQLGYWDSPLNKNELFKRLTLMTDATPEQITIHSTTKVNTAGNKYIAYLFASVPGICDIGSYTGNGVTSKNIDCGFTNGARFVLIKRTDAAGDWAVFDVARGITNSDSPYIKLNTTEAQVTGSYIAPLSVADDYVGGFKLVSADPNINASQGTYIYIAIA
jgi:hypothetical protein